jgi:hypothetical protein
MFIPSAAIMIMKIKISATFEGDCMICKKEKVVFTAGDEETKKVVTLCQDCARDLGNTTTSDVIEKYGVHDKEAFGKQAIQIHGLEKAHQKLKERQKKAASEAKMAS